MMKPMEEISTNPPPKVANTSSSNSTCVEMKKPIRPQKEKALNCPRCSSTNTKFCYYNNYSLTQPRYYCKACKRYWTQGGALRSIPVGGRTRKYKRSSYSSTKMIKLPDLVDQSSNINIITNPNPKLVHHAQDLNLGFTPSNLNGHFINQTLDASNIFNSSSYMSAVELLTGIGIASSRGVMQASAPFMPMQIPTSYPNNSVYPVGFSLQADSRPNLSFSLDGNIGSDGRILFPFESLRSTTTATATATATGAAATINTTTDDQHITRDRQHGDSTGYWTGNILGGAGSW